MTKLYLLVFLLWPSISEAYPQESCLVKNRKCDLVGENLISTEAGVTRLECKQLCEDDLTCNVFSYFGPDSFPYHEFCMLFASCEALDDCQDCITANMKSDCTCGIGYEGSIDSENIVYIQEEVLNERECRKLCSANESCTIYTYYDDSHVTDERLCILLNAIKEPIRSCENCQTGSDRCQPFEDCKLVVWDAGDQFSIDRILVTETKIVKYVSREDGCILNNVNAVAVGFGGNGGNCAKYGGGGGSGYISTVDFALPFNTSIKVQISNSGAGTSLTMEDTGGILLSSANGEVFSGCVTNGGDGYSGGGGASSSGNGGDGGSGGQDGEDGSYSAGTGSGFDISSIETKYTSLSAGEGGDHIGTYGGGGGGLLFDGSGPENGDMEGNGKGYGGGGKGDPDTAVVSGSTGCILLEL